MKYIQVNPFTSWFRTFTFRNLLRKCIQKFSFYYYLTNFGKLGNWVSFSPTTIRVFSTAVSERHYYGYLLLPTTIPKFPILAIWLQLGKHDRNVVAMLILLLFFCLRKVRIRRQICRKMGDSTISPSSVGYLNFTKPLTV